MQSHLSACIYHLIITPSKGHLVNLPAALACMNSDLILFSLLIFSNIKYQFICCDRIYFTRLRYSNGDKVDIVGQLFDIFMINMTPAIN